ncbi:hypothetical protein GA0115246_109816 [Streptomyces sp. SolWspMP-sol7th]|nr:hypothetical protein GA0115246_109816 [Streptomyces sp. SolWspMP-sol7th]
MRVRTAVALTPEARSGLREFVRVLAEEAGTRAPACVVLTADVNAADRLAARLAGRTATASALRELPALESSFAYHLDRYALAGTDRGLLPPRGEVFGGYGRLLDARQLALVHMRTELPDEPASPYDSHPPLAARVRRIEELPEDGRTDEGRPGRAPSAWHRAGAGGTHRAWRRATAGRAHSAWVRARRA